MRKLYPIIKNGSVSVRSSTFKHMEALLASLMLLVGLAKFTFGELLLSTIARVYHLIHAEVLVDPESIIKKLKAAQAWYLNIVRGFPSVNAQDFDHPENFFLPRAAGEKKGSPITGLRDTVAREYRAGLLFFDRIIYAFLSIHRLMITPPLIDFTTITSPSKWDKDTKGSLTMDEIKAALLALGITQEKFMSVYAEKCKTQWHVLLHTAGPNGKASWTAYSDAVALLNNPELLKQLTSFSEQSKLGGLLRDLFQTVNLPGVDGGTGNPLYTAKIHTFEEWGGKTRNVAIIDYWTQLLVTPLHDTLFEFLSRIPMDATFDQDAACEQIKAWTAVSAKQEVYSCDLTAATDRLPAGFQTQVLEALTGNATLAANWAKIFTMRSYHTVEKTNIHYGAGLPMGSKSNWAMLAMTHHVIIQAAAIAANQTGYTNYRVCGDDSVICGTKVREAYTSLMTTYGLTINLAKSVYHKAGLLPAAEFCKRVFVNGEELTSLPVKLLVKTTMNGRLAPQLQNELTKRGSMVGSSYYFDFLAGILDNESLEFMLILNAIPRNLSGLTRQVPPPGAIANISEWYSPSHTVTEQDITQAYLYVLVTEQLKRLDVLMRQTDLIEQAINKNAVGYSVPNYNVKIKLPSGQEEELMKHIGVKIEGLSPYHPILSAAYAENVRISSLLSAIRTGNVEMSAPALSSLLDQFRNALIDSWDDKRAARGQAERSLVSRSLDTLANIITMPTENKNKEPIPRKIDFTVMLAYVSRLWSVTWTLGTNVMINAVKSKVKSVPSQATGTLSNLVTSFTFKTRFPGRTASSSKNSPQVGSP